MGEYKEGFDSYMKNEIDCPYDIEDGQTNGCSKM